MEVEDFVSQAFELHHGRPPSDRGLESILSVLENPVSNRVYPTAEEARETLRRLFGAKTESEDVPGTGEHSCRPVPVWPPGPPCRGLVFVTLLSDLPGAICPFALASAMHETGGCAVTDYSVSG